MHERQKVQDVLHQLPIRSVAPHEMNWNTIIRTIALSIRIFQPIFHHSVAVRFHKHVMEESIVIYRRKCTIFIISSQNIMKAIITIISSGAKVICCIGKTSKFIFVLQKSTFYRTTVTLVCISCFLLLFTTQRYSMAQ